MPFCFTKYLAEWHFLCKFAPTAIPPTNHLKRIRTMEKYFLIGIACTLGVVAVIGVAIIIIGIIRRISDNMDSRESKAKTVLGDRETYLKRQMFEELSYIKKYQKQLEKGEWPSEMNKKFEYEESKNKGYVCEVTEEGIVIKPRKRFLRLKECFKHNKKKDAKAKEQQAEDVNNKKDNNKQ